MIISIFLLFLLINSFYVYAGINSSIAAAIIVFPFVLFRLATGRVVVNNVSINYYYRIYISYLILLVAVCFFPVVHMTGDISYLIGFSGVVVQFVCIIVVVSYILNRAKVEKYGGFFNYLTLAIVYGFAIQALIELIAFVEPGFAEIIHYTYPPGYAETIYDDFNGIRGLALSGSAGWGLTIGFGISMLAYFNYCSKLNSLNIKNYTIMILLIVGNLFAGRTGYLGLLLGILLYVSSGISIFRLLREFAELGIGSVIVILACSIIFPDVFDKVINAVLPFVFEMFYNYFEHGEAKTWSTNRLREMWDVEISPLTYLIGDGKFTSPVDGAYYMKTDVGYIRNILFGGVGMAVITLLVTANMFPRFTWNNYLSNKFFIFLFVMLAVFEAKAMVFSYNKYAYTMVIIFSLGALLDRRKMEKYFG